MRTMKYQLYIYEVWGNSRDGYDVNDVYRTDTIIEFTLPDNATDYLINRRLKARGLKWEGETDYTLYAHNKRNGKPVCELRKIEG